MVALQKKSTWYIKLKLCSPLRCGHKPLSQIRKLLFKQRTPHCINVVLRNVRFQGMGVASGWSSATRILLAGWCWYALKKKACHMLFKGPGWLKKIYPGWFLKSQGSLEWRKTIIKSKNQTIDLWAWGKTAWLRFGVGAPQRQSEMECQTMDELKCSSAFDVHERISWTKSGKEQRRVKVD